LRNIPPRAPAFMCERMQQDAVIRKLEVIGEAVKQLSTARRPSVSIAGVIPHPSEAQQHGQIGAQRRVRATGKLI